MFFKEKWQGRLVMVNEGRMVYGGVLTEVEREGNLVRFLCRGGVRMKRRNGVWSLLQTTQIAFADLRHDRPCRAGNGRIRVITRTGSVIVIEP